METKKLIRQSFEICIKRRMDFAMLFYQDLFLHHPELRLLFHGDGSTHERMLTEFLISVVDKLDDAPWINTIMHGLGVRHAGYQVTPEMFAWFWNSFVVTLKRVSGNLWSEQLESAWQKTFTELRDMMLEGLRSAEKIA